MSTHGALELADQTIFSDMAKALPGFSYEDFTKTHYFKEAADQVSSDLETAFDVLGRLPLTDETKAYIGLVMAGTERELLFQAALGRNCGQGFYERMLEHYEADGGYPVYRLFVTFEGPVPSFRWSRRGRDKKNNDDTTRRVYIGVAQKASSKKERGASQASLNLRDFVRYDIRSFVGASKIERAEIKKTELELAEIRRRISHLKQVRRSILLYAQLLITEQFPK